MVFQYTDKEVRTREDWNPSPTINFWFFYLYTWLKIHFSQKNREKSERENFEFILIFLKLIII